MIGTGTDTGWEEANRDHLVAELRLLRLFLRPDSTESDRREADEALSASRLRLSGDSALDQVARGFGLTRFERSLLLLAAGPEFIREVAGELLTACGSPHLSFSAALCVLPEPHWSALTPSAPLRHWDLVRLLDPSSLTRSPLAVDERVLHHLAGAGRLDAELAAVSRPVSAHPQLPAPMRHAAEAIAQALSRRQAVVVSGPQRANLRTVTATAACSQGLQLMLVAVADLASSAGERQRAMRLMERETVLGNCAWAVDLEYAGTAECDAIARLASAFDAPIALLADEGTPALGHGLTSVRLERLAPADRRELLRSALDRAGAPVADADGTAGIFDLSLDAAEAAAGDVASGVSLWHACRERARPSFSGLAKVQRARATWGDLVLPPGQAAQLRALAASIRHRTTVLDDWGFAGRSARGLGTTALFTGPSGTGKTLAAEVLAGDLELDLVHIDLSQVVNKYIGETEKNLSRVFDAAEDSAAVLLFDEADTLFGKRTEARDSHDRYANLEIGYLLQRLETFRGLAILTTNARSAMDQAFTRRLHTVVNFPHPDPAMREALWRKAFPPHTPVDGLDLPSLAAMDLTGGAIAAVALSAAYLAAADNSPVTIEHVRAATRWELAKSGRSPVAGGASA
ncbi:ATP-binding protein [Streptomyces sp. NPDC001513]|uniref:ATP-binding protein n=1 Tax=Streptomyces sp. NPDC001513 TaxID=3364580 RepID=UPI0036AB29A1